jgi:hypothetical protein
MNSTEEFESRPIEEQIAALAHALWRERGCPEGSPEDDWYKAEQQIGETVDVHVKR